MDHSADPFANAPGLEGSTRGNSDDLEDNSTTPQRRMGLPGRLFSAAAGFGEAAARTAAAAATLISDSELRRRGVVVVASNAAKGVKGIQRGLQTVGNGPRQLQSVLQRLARQMEEQRMSNLIQQQRDAPVDVQVGCQLYEDAPQELRSRLWMALLTKPEISVRIREAIEIASLEEKDNTSMSKDNTSGADNDRPCEVVDSYRIGDQDDKNNQRIFEKTSNTGDQIILQDENQKSKSSFLTKNDRDPSETVERQESLSLFRSKEEQFGSFPIHTFSNNDEDVCEHESKNIKVVEEQRGEENDWEIVAEKGARRWCEGRILLRMGNRDRIEPWTDSKESIRQDLMVEMTNLPWPIPTEVSDESRYSTLLQISIGQEDQDEAISRDVHRTFPEYPLFAFHQGQQALFRVLKAYSLHDLEVGYCQGMAFVAGLLLFYVPEEPAFQIFCRLLCASGPNLRQNYLPGLDGLKLQLKAFELLLERRMPSLKSHLDDAGAVPVLYASQWFLSVFSCPFPVSFACRIVDIMLTTNSDLILLRVSLTIMAECEAELLMQDNFEELLTYLKVTPASWEPHKLRRVLNAALNSPVSDKELLEILRIAENQEHPLLQNTRPKTKNVQDKNQERRGPHRASSSSSEERSVVNNSIGSHSRNSALSSNADTASSLGRKLIVSNVNNHMVEENHSGEFDELTESTLGDHNAELEDAMMRMALDIDQAWWGSSVDGEPVEAIYGRALKESNLSDKDE